MIATIYGSEVDLLQATVDCTYSCLYGEFTLELDGEYVGIEMGCYDDDVDVATDPEVIVEKLYDRLESFLWEEGCDDIPAEVQSHLCEEIWDNDSVQRYIKECINNCSEVIEESEDTVWKGTDAEDYKG